MILVYITCKDEKEAKKIAMHLLKKRLIACANFFPIKSMYWWKKAITMSSEFVLIGKTKRPCYEELTKEVSRIHSYTIPCIIQIPIGANSKYERWLLQGLS